jgi:hypothetical protein
MTTVGKWEDIFPELEDNQKLSQSCNSALMLLAAWGTRSGLSNQASILKKILEAYLTSPINPMDNQAMEDLGRLVYYLVKAQAAKPSTWIE